MRCIRDDTTTPILLRGHSIKSSAKYLSYTIHEKYTSEPLSEKILCSSHLSIQRSLFGECEIMECSAVNQIAISNHSPQGSLISTEDGKERL